MIDDAPPDPHLEVDAPASKPPTAKAKRYSASRKIDNKPRALRTKDKVLVVSGVAAGKVGVIKSMDAKREPQHRYFVVPANRADEDKQVMGRFSSAELERIL